MKVDCDDAISPKQKESGRPRRAHEGILDKKNSVDVVAKVGFPTRSVLQLKRTLEGSCTSVPVSAGPIAHQRRDAQTRSDNRQDCPANGL